MIRVLHEQSSESRMEGQTVLYVKITEKVKQ